jgi:hypothetical protein
MENKTLYAVQLREGIVSHIYAEEASQNVESAFPFLKSRELIALGKYERTKSYLMYAANVDMLWAKAKYLYINKGYETCLDDEIIVRLNLPPVGDINGDYISKVFVLTTDLDKAQRYVNSNSTQINDEPPRIQPSVRENMDIIWDDDGKCALLISPMEGVKEAEVGLSSWPKKINWDFRDTRRMSREEACSFIRWDVVDMERAFIEG